jgi:hypothetical protein
VENKVLRFYIDSELGQKKDIWKRLSWHDRTWCLRPCTPVLLLADCMASRDRSWRG